MLESKMGRKYSQVFTDWLNSIGHQATMTHPLQLLASSLSERLGPLSLAWVLLLIKQLAAL
jgi:hypothetical protein